MGDGQGAPASWNVATGEGVRFKTPIPGIGLASPIVWGDRIYVTTAVSSKGDATFRTGLYGDTTSVEDRSEHSFRLYALDTKEGKVIWERDIGILDSNDPQSGTDEWGHASSPILVGDRVIVQADRKKDSFLAAYRLSDGTEIWRVARSEPSTCDDPRLRSALRRGALASRAEFRGRGRDAAGGRRPDLRHRRVSAGASGVRDPSRAAG